MDSSMGSILQKYVIFSTTVLFYQDDYEIYLYLCIYLVQEIYVKRAFKTSLVCNAHMIGKVKTLVYLFKVFLIF